IEDLSLFVGMHPTYLAPRWLDSVLKLVRKSLPGNRKKWPVDVLRQTESAVGMMVAWTMAVALAEEASSHLRMQNTDGHAMLWTEDHYDLVPGREAAVKQAVLTVPGAEADDTGQLVKFLREGNAKHKSWTNTVVGEAQFKASTLILRSNSIPRADDLRAAVEAACGADLRFRARSHSDPLPDGQSPARAAGPVEPMPPEVAAVMREFRQAHMHEWVDEPIPALDGKTPREAAKDRKLRPRLIALLDQFDNSEARTPEDHRIDWSWARRELGV
ncbi:MAG: hypothetical protein ACOYOB_20025, partial [Myxococcota bacterium]